MQESSLHASLKSFYAQSGGNQEALIDGYLIDVMQDGILMEIQTRNFSAIKDKIKILLNEYTVRLIHPIALEKWIVKLPAKGSKPTYRRKSPKRGRLEDIFNELVHIGHIIPNPRFQFEVIFIFEEEIRRDDGKGSWRRKGVSIYDRRLLKVVEIRKFDSPDDYLGLIPDTLPRPFTNRQLAEGIKIRPRLASKMTYCLRKAGILTVVGKQVNALLFDINSLPLTSNIYHKM